MVIHENYHLIVTKEFFIFYLPSSSHAYDSFTLGVKSQSIVYLLSGCEHIYIGSWALKLRCTQYGFCEQRQPSRIQGHLFLGSWVGMQCFSIKFNKNKILSIDPPPLCKSSLKRG